MKEQKTEEAMVQRVEAPLVLPDAKNARLLATDLFNSKMFRGIDTVPMAIAVIQCGVELGIPPIQALQNIKPIKGQLALSARLLMALAASKGRVTWEVIESTDQRCEIIFNRPGWKPLKETFTIEEAKKAGLVKADSGWSNYPKDMLFARCGSRGIRRIAMDLTLGIYSVEEIQDATIYVTAEPVKGGPEPGKPGPAPAVDPFPERDEPAPQPGAGTPQDKPGPQPHLPGASPGSDEGSGGPVPPGQTDGPPPGDEEEDDPLRHAETAEGHEEEDREKEFLITTIKEKLAQEKIDEREFKDWLFHLQNSYRPVKAFCGKMGKAIRFHMGKTADLKYLAGKMDTSILVFKGEKEKKA